MDNIYLDTVLSKYCNTTYYKETSNQLRLMKEKLEQVQKAVEALSSSLIKEEENMEYQKYRILMLEKFDKSVWYHFYPEWKGEEPVFDKDSCITHIRADLVHILSDSDDYEAAKAFIEDELDCLEKNNLNNIRSYIEYDSIIDEVAIRRDFGTYLKSMKDVSKLASLLRFSFGKKDILHLAELHKKNKYRKKIEDLLSCCNYHHEAGALSSKKYEEVLVNFD